MYTIYSITRTVSCLPSLPQTIIHTYSYSSYSTRTNEELSFFFESKEKEDMFSPPPAPSLYTTPSTTPGATPVQSSKGLVPGTGTGMGVGIERSDGNKGGTLSPIIEGSTPASLAGASLADDSTFNGRTNLNNTATVASAAASGRTTGTTDGWTMSTGGDAGLGGGMGGGYGGALGGGSTNPMSQSDADFTRSGINQCIDIGPNKKYRMDFLIPQRYSSSKIGQCVVYSIVLA